MDLNGIKIKVMIELKNGPWYLGELKSVPQNELKVFSCFACGGGSTMGYKLAGFNVIGCNEIDPNMAKVYKANHNPKHLFVESISTFRKHDDLPKELFELDILDGSPPCSSFSMSGSREKTWGKKKKFKEGQAKQVLDDLFFEFIALADRLKPKVVVAENVKGLISGNAKFYVKQIFEKLNEAGYDTQLFLLNAAEMGVPQKRQRIFFISRRKDLNLPKLKLKFKEKPIVAGQALEGIKVRQAPTLSLIEGQLWDKVAPGQRFCEAHPNKSWFSQIKLNPRQIAPTLTSKECLFYHWSDRRKILGLEVVRLQTFPEDYNFLNQKEHYICGMSVPPFMMQRIANQIYLQLIKN